MADNYLYDEAMDSSIPVEHMISKEMLYVIDQNGGSYNGQIQLDTSTLANSGKWLSYSEAYLEVPFAISFKSTVDITGSINAYFAGLKCGSHQIIDSISVDYNNTNVVQLTPNLNFFVQYKLMSTFSQDDIKKWGSTLMFQPDNAKSFIFKTAGAGENGDGTSNNRILRGVNPDYSTALGYERQNDGYLKRMNLMNYNLLTGATPGAGNIPGTNTGVAVKAVGKNHLIDDAGAGAARIYTYNLLLTIKLKHLSDFFDKIPLVKGAFLRFSINYNSCTQTITNVIGTRGANAVGTAGTLIVGSTSLISGRTVPYMVSSAGLSLVGGYNQGNLGYQLTNGVEPNQFLASGTITVACGVKTNSLLAGNQPNALLSTCRLYCPAYQLNPTYESQLISLKPTREVLYNDIYNYNILNIGAGQAFNTILTNGIVDPQYIVVLPFLNNAVANSGVTGNLSPYQSPFDSAPGSTSPLLSIAQWQVQLSGRNVFSGNVQYDFDAFINELSSINAINGGLSDGLSNGLTGHEEFDNGYRYYIADLSRRLPMENSVSKSVVIQGINNNPNAIDLVCFIAFKRKIVIDNLTGALLSS